MGFLINDFVKSGGIPLHLIIPLIDNYKIPALIETGSASGQSAREAAALFEKVFTVELITNRQVTDNSPSNIEWFVGQSVDKIPEILRSINNDEYAICFLDAHYSGDVENESDIIECPVIGEVQALASFQKAVIIIDDARLFLGAPPYPLDPREWPTLINVIEQLKQHFPAHYITLIDDYIICVPGEIKDLINAEWRKNFKYRYPAASEKLKTEAQHVFCAIKNYLQ